MFYKHILEPLDTPEEHHETISGGQEEVWLHLTLRDAALQTQTEESIWVRWIN